MNNLRTVFYVKEFGLANRKFSLGTLYERQKDIPKVVSHPQYSTRTNRSKNNEMQKDKPTVRALLVSMTDVGDYLEKNHAELLGHCILSFDAPAAINTQSKEKDIIRAFSNLVKVLTIHHDQPA